MVPLNKRVNTKSFYYNKEHVLFRYCSMASVTMNFFSFNFFSEFRVPARYREKVFMNCVTVLPGFELLTALM